jgi:cytochrome c553
MPDREHSSRRGQSAIRTVFALALLGPSAGVVAADDPKVLAYGRHLAQECTSCHKLDGTSNGIPPIIGRPVEEFTAALKAFQDGLRTNAAMVSVAQSLDDDQVKALALYFASLGK